MTLAIDNRDLQGRVDLLDLISRDTVLRKVASTRGGEYAGPCPSCSGDDRFHVQPEQERWMCRQCHERWSDPIEYLRYYHGLTFADACRELGIDVLGRLVAASAPRSALPIARRAPATPVLAKAPQAPPAAWRERAERYVTTAEARLWSPAGDRARQWLTERGLTEQSIRQSRLGYEPAVRYEAPTTWGLPSAEPKVMLPRGIVIPWWRDGVLWQIKVLRPGGNPRYWAVRGGRPGGLYGAATLADHDTAALPEGEFDVILLEQECGDLIGAATLGSASGRLDVLAARDLLGVTRILCTQDNDRDGERQAAHIGALTARADRLRVPVGKDLTDFVKAGGSLRAWVEFELERRRLLPAQRPTQASMPSWRDVFAVMKERDLLPLVQAGELRIYRYSPSAAEGYSLLAADDPFWAILTPHRQVVTEMCTPAPCGRCVFSDCYRLRVPGETTCPDHRREPDAATACPRCGQGRGLQAFGADGPALCTSCRAALGTAWLRDQWTDAAPSQPAGAGWAETR